MLNIFCGFLKLLPQNGGSKKEEKYGQKIKPLIYAMEDRKLRDKKSLCSDEHGRHRPFRLDGEEPF